MAMKDAFINPVMDKQSSVSVEEGKATVIFPSALNVFYNPVQEFNRDISIAVLRLFSSDQKLIKTKKKIRDSTENIKRKEEHLTRIKEKDYDLVSENTDLLIEGEQDPDGIVILEALAASGLRSVRYAKEIGGIKQIITNDFSEAAVECIKTNIKQNNVDKIIKPSYNDASLVMYEKRNVKEQFTVVDLDPYGSPHTFLDGAVQSIRDGGLLMVTCTDMAVLCGKAPETCYAKYGSLSINIRRACHEMALRIVLQCIESNANKYGKYIVPLLSISVDFYCRIFVKIFTSPIKCKETFTKISYVHHCNKCDSTTLQKLGEKIVKGKSIKYQLSSPVTGTYCRHCKGKLRTGGPIWSDPIHDTSFVRRLRQSLVQGTPLNTGRRIEGILSVVEEELSDVPLYFAFDKLFNIVHRTTIKMKEFTSALLNAGYKVSRTHAAKIGIKTDAPEEFIWKIMCQLNKKNPVNLSKYPLDDPVHIILSNKDNDNKLPDINFQIHPEAEMNSKHNGLLRFQINPQKNWGPKARAVTNLCNENLQEKCKKKQNKRKRNVDGENETSKKIF